MLSWWKQCAVPQNWEKIPHRPSVSILRSPKSSENMLTHAAHRRSLAYYILGQKYKHLQCRQTGTQINVISLDDGILSLTKRSKVSQLQWFLPLSTVLRRLKRKDHEFEAILGCGARPGNDKIPRWMKSEKLFKLKRSHYTTLLLWNIWGRRVLTNKNHINRHLVWGWAVSLPKVSWFGGVFLGGGGNGNKNVLEWCFSACEPQPL